LALPVQDRRGMRGVLPRLVTDLPPRGRGWHVPVPSPRGHGRGVPVPPQDLSPGWRRILALAATSEHRGPNSAAIREGARNGFRRFSPN